MAPRTSAAVAFLSSAFESVVMVVRSAPVHRTEMLWPPRPVHVAAGSELMQATPVPDRRQQTVGLIRRPAHAAPVVLASTTMQAALRAPSVDALEVL